MSPARKKSVSVKPKKKDIKKLESNRRQKLFREYKESLAKELMNFENLACLKHNLNVHNYKLKCKAIGEPNNSLNTIIENITKLQDFKKNLFNLSKSINIPGKKALELEKLMKKHTLLKQESDIIEREILKSLKLIPLKILQKKPSLEYTKLNFKNILKIDHGEFVLFCMQEKITFLKKHGDSKNLLPLYKGLLVDFKKINLLNSESVRNSKTIKRQTENYKGTLRTENIVTIISNKINRRNTLVDKISTRIIETISEYGSFQLFVEDAFKYHENYLKKLSSIDRINLFKKLEFLKPKKNKT